jgi:hypothetical protein
MTLFDVSLLSCGAYGAGPPSWDFFSRSFDFFPVPGLILLGPRSFCVIGFIGTCSLFRYGFPPPFSSANSAFLRAHRCDASNVPVSASFAVRRSPRSFRNRMKRV